MAGFGLKGILRAWGPGLVRVSGSFAIVSSAVSASRPSRPAGTVVRKAAGKYLFTLNQAFNSVEGAGGWIGPAAGKAGAALDAAVPGYVIVSQDFMTFDATNANYASDSTNKNLVIITLNSANNAIAEVPSNYRCNFWAVLCESALNK